MASPFKRARVARAAPSPPLASLQERCAFALLRDADPRLPDRLELPKDVVDILLRLMTRFSMVKSVTLSAILGPEITQLNLTSCQQIEDVHLDIIGSHCPNLSDLNLASCSRITDLTPLRSLQHLVNVNVDRCERIVRVVLPHVRQLSAKWVGGLSHLAVPNCEHLDLREVEVTEPIEVPPRLKSVCVIHCSLSGDSFLAQLNQPSCVHLSGPRVTDDGLLDNVAGPTLTELSLLECDSVTTAGINACLARSSISILKVIKCKQIHSLRVPAGVRVIKCDVPIVAFGASGELTSLKSNAGVPAAILSSCGSLLTSLRIRRHGEFNLSLLQTLFEQTPNLVHLDVSECLFLTSEIVEFFPLHLQRLNLEDCVALTDSCMQHIGKMTQMQMLSFKGVQALTDASIMELSLLTSLRGLNVSNNVSLTNLSLPLICSFHQLEILEVNYTRFTLDAVLRAVSALDRLSALHGDCLSGPVEATPLPFNLLIETLSLAWCQDLDDASLKAIATSFANVSNLDIGWCRAISSKVVKEICSQNRNIFRLRVAGIELDSLTHQILTRGYGIMLFIR